MSVWLEGYFLNNGIGRTGLSPLPTVTLYKLSDNSEALSAVSTTEIGGGGYKYDFTSGYDPDEEYWGVMDAGSAVPDCERYAYLIPRITNEQVNAECDTALSDYDAPTDTEMEAAFNEIKGSTWSSSTDTLEHIRDKQTDIETDTQDLQSQIGTAGDGLTDLGGMSTTMKGQVNTECDTAISDYDPPTKAEMDTAHALLATPAQVNEQVLDVMNVDTFAEPGQGAPPATASIFAKINYLYKRWRNKYTETSSQANVYNDAGDTIDQKASLSDDGTTFTEGEYGSGP